MSGAGIQDPLLQPCSEKSLSRVAKELERWEPVYLHLDVTSAETEAIKSNHPGNYEYQKFLVLNKWREKKGLAGTFKVLTEVFTEHGNQQIVAVINRVAEDAYQEPSEVSVIELTKVIQAVGFDRLNAIATQLGLLSETHAETLEDAPNEMKKIEVILQVLMSLFKPQLLNYFYALMTDKSYGPPMIMSPPAEQEDETIIRRESPVQDVEHQFRLTVRRIKGHLQNCNVQDLIIEFNVIADKRRIPYLKRRVREKLYKCKTVGDLFARLSPFISLWKRDILRVLVEVSGSKEAIDELNEFEERWLNRELSITDFPLPNATNSICPDQGGDVTIISMRANDDLNDVTLGKTEQFQRVVEETGGLAEGNLEMQGKNTGSSVLYWLIPKDVIVTFEQKIRKHLDFLYEHGIIEISIDPNIVITTGRKLRVRSLAYLTKVPDIPVGRAEELDELPSSEDKPPERFEEVTELAFELKRDKKKKEKELDKKHKQIVELVEDLKIKEQVVEEKEQECVQLRDHLDQSTQENKDLKQIIEVAAQPRDQEDKVAAAAPPKRGFQCQQGVDLVFGTRGHTAVKCGDKVYVGGGVTTNANGAAPNIIQVIHLQDNNVSTLPVCPVKQFSLVVVNDQVVTVGGRNMSDDSVSNKLYSWNEANRQWEESLPPMPTPRYFNTSVVWQGFLITCGGRIDDEDSITDCVEMLSLRSLNWRTASPMPLKESGKHAVVTERGGLYLLGGYLGNAVHYCQLQSLVLSLTTKQDETWKKLVDTPSDDCAATLLDGSPVIIGGCTAGTNEICSTVQRYAQDTWQVLGDLSCGRTACVAVQLGRNEALVIGGTVSRDRPEWFSKSTEKMTL